MLGKGCNIDDFRQIWVKIWSFEANPKVRHFLWRLYTKSLLFRALLHHQHFIKDASCTWGCGELETPCHVIFGFPRIARLWADGGCGDCVPGIQIQICVMSLRDGNSLTKKLQSRGDLLAWCIWDERNK